MCSVSRPGPATSPLPPLQLDNYRQVLEEGRREGEQMTKPGEKVNKATSNRE